ncbi:Mannose-binding lectin superfamily protein [Rhynchospora pubera]|uniref:Mannose-binding lectin superfamily protein n=1 Tax=Rhynchospora pubera TaxID=906938 RepID=A0AAV8DFV5_9POAL|nr:Mannose-binding lectin superfamily protein [Rhynchospora pubera]
MDESATAIVNAIALIIVSLLKGISYTVLVLADTIEDFMNLCVDATSISRTIKKYKPHGNLTGTQHKLDDKIGEIVRVVKVTVHHNAGAVCALVVRFQRSDGSQSSHVFGNKCGTAEEITLKSGEHITCIRGRIGLKKGINCVRSIEVQTNHQVFGPYGRDDRKYSRFKFLANSGQIIGFHGYHGEFMHAIGVYAKTQIRNH